MFTRTCHHAPRAWGASTSHTQSAPLRAARGDSTRAATAATTAADAYSLPVTPEGANAARASTGLGGIPKQWKGHAEQALASPEYMAVRKDTLARLAKDDGDLEIDAIWTCSTGDSVERMQARMRAQAADATKEEQEAASSADSAH